MARNQRDEENQIKIRYPAVSGLIGATAGFTINSSNLGLALCPASQTSATWVIPLTSLREGDIITSMKLSGQGESAANAYTVDMDLRETTAAAAEHSDASVQAMTQVAKTADYLIDEETAIATHHTITAGKQCYALITITTAASTDVALGYLELTIKRLVE